MTLKRRVERAEKARRKMTLLLRTEDVSDEEWDRYYAERVANAMPGESFVVIEKELL